MSALSEIHALQQAALNALERASQIAFARPNAWLARYFILLLLAFLAYQLASPVVLGDTDMWYHLAGGRFFWTTGAIPDTPYFSFAFPYREWTSYFWGFQAAIYPVYEALGYQGMVIVRALLFIASLFVVGVFIRRSNNNRWSWAAILLVIGYFLLIEGRAYQLRPHLVSYALIPLFLYILEYRPRWLPALPLLTALWANLHGVEWVIGATVVGAYCIEHLVKAYQQPDTTLDKRRVLWMLSCLPALMINPFGWMILTAPFAIPEGLSHFISELRPLSPHAFFTVTLGSNGLGAATLLTGLTALTLASVVRQLLVKEIRLSHLIMAVCGYILLTRGNRFVYEWAFLVLPLAASILPSLRIRQPSTSLSPLPLMIALLILAAPLYILVEKLPSNLTRYPFNGEGLPVGLTTFLSKAHAHGNLLIAPSYGGYINWELTPAIKIHSDMEFPPFTAVDALEISLVMRGNQISLSQYAAHHQIDFLAVKLSHEQEAKRIVEVLPLRPIFFDDAFVLYANTETQSSVIEKSDLTAINPFNLKDDKGAPEAHLTSLLKMHDLQPDSRRINHAITRILLEKKSFDKAKRYGELFARLYPDDPNSEYLLGNIAEQTDHFDAAIKHYQAAMEYADDDFKRVLYRHIGANHYLSKRFDEAYDAFSMGVNLFQRIEDPETLYQYAYAAAVTGHEKVAQRMLRAVTWVADKQHHALQKKAAELLDVLSSD